MGVQGGVWCGSRCESETNWQQRSQGETPHPKSYTGRKDFFFPNKEREKKKWRNIYKKDGLVIILIEAYSRTMKHVHLWTGYLISVSPTLFLHLLLNSYLLMCIQQFRLAYIKADSIMRQHTRWRPINHISTSKMIIQLKHFFFSKVKKKKKLFLGVVPKFNYRLKSFKIVLLHTHQWSIGRLLCTDWLIYTIFIPSLILLENINNPNWCSTTLHNISTMFPNFSSLLVEAERISSAGYQQALNILNPWLYTYKSKDLNHKKEKKR